MEFTVTNNPIEDLRSRLEEDTKHNSLSLNSCNLTIDCEDVTELWNMLPEVWGTSYGFSPTDGYHCLTLQDGSSFYEFKVFLLSVEKNTGKVGFDVKETTTPETSESLGFRITPRYVWRTNR